MSSARRAIAALLLASGTACSSAVAGHGSAVGSPAGPGGGSTAGSASSASLPAPPGTGGGGGLQTPSHSTSVPSGGQDVTVTGSETQRTYRIRVRATDHLTDCVTHAYGAPLVSFLRRHDCQSATRRLVTLDLGGSTVALSIITVTMPPDNAGDGAKLFSYAGRLAQLENADGTGSMDDLLREGVRVPGLQSAIPGSEAFLVLGQDLVVTIFDGWFVHSATPDQDPRVLALEHDLFVTPVSSDA
jgi:hypothetical protein